MRNLALFLVLAALLVPAPAAAGELAGVTLPETVQAGDQSLALNGMAVRSKAIFKVYVAGLYLPARQSDWQTVLSDDTARHFVMHWVRSVDKGKICDGWYEGLEANTPDAAAAVKNSFDTLCDYMEDAKTGDQFVFTYLPGTGTTVSVKGKSKGTIEGKPFADALFACWIGKKPGPGEGFRAGLMGTS